MRKGPTPPVAGLVFLWVLFGLAGCEILALSPFPEYLSLAVTSYDLSRYLGDPDSSSTRLDVLYNGAGEYVFLQIDRPGSSGRLLIFDTDLRPLKDHTRDEIPYPGSLGSLRMVDDSFRFVAGSFLFDPVTLDPAGTIDPLPADNKGFAILPGNPMGRPSRNYLFSVTSAAQSDLQIQTSVGWAAPTSSSVKLAAPGITDLQIDGAYYGAERDELLLALRRGDTVSLYVVPSNSAAAVEFFTNAPSVPLMAIYPYLPLTDVRHGGFHLTAAGLIAHTNEGWWERYAFEDEGKMTDRMRAPRDTLWMDDAFSPHGDYFYVVDRREKRLYKLATWW